MMGKRNVLICLDGSEFSRHVLPHVSRLCEPATDTIILLRVAEPAESMIPLPPKTVSSAWMEPYYTSARDIEFAAHPIYASQLEQNERAAIEREMLRDERRLRKAGFRTEVIVRFGNAAGEIASVVEQQAIDMVAMATHGRTGLRSLLMGSVAQQVVRRVNVPVLLVRPFVAEGLN